MYHIIRQSILLFLCFVVISPLFAAPTDSQTIHLKLDCRHCDRDYLQEEIPWISFVRDRQSADVHVISTYQRNSSSGREYTLTFSGLRDFEGLCDTLNFSTPPAVAREEARSLLAQQIKLGLVRYLARTPLGRELSVTCNAVNVEESPPGDKWNSWVFSSRLGSFFNGEESRNSISLWGNLNAQRITAESKIKITCWGNYNHDRYEYEYDDTSYVYISESNSRGFSSEWAKSLTDHWSAGCWGGISSSTYNNKALAWRFGPGLEYNIYPYSESARRQLRITYLMSGRRFLYDEETIYLKESESLVEHTLAMRLELVRNWGSVSVDLSGSQYLHDLTKNEANLYGDLSLQLVRGLSLSLDGQVSLIHNQLSLPRSDADLEELLLQRRQLSTQYDYWLSVGFRYTFGSIYSSVVNTRFGEW